MERLTLTRDLIFGYDEVKNNYPGEVLIDVDLKESNADIDVIIAGYGQPEMTNNTVLNYLHFERNASVHLIVIESSDSPDVQKKIIKHPSVSRIFFLKDYKITYDGLGNASPALALSFAVGKHFAKAPYVFFSHNDMIAYRHNFLSFLQGKLRDGYNLASFTQRHLIPFTGCMMVKRRIIENSELSWAPKNHNRFLTGNRALRNLSSRIKELRYKQFPKALRWIDCGEDYVYNELFNNNPVYVVASVGGASDVNKHPFEYFSSNRKKVQRVVHHVGLNVTYAENTYSNNYLAQNYPEVVEAVIDKQTGQKADRYWRYSFDDEGRLIFMHRGRGSSLQNYNLWLQFSKSLINV